MPGRLTALLLAATKLWGVLEAPVYDVIVVGAGAAGCPLAQTLAEGGVRVLLLERGGERVEASKTLARSVDALTDKCAESMRSVSGVTVTTGNCMGGATSVNHGIWVQEETQWVQNMTTESDKPPSLTTDEIAAAYDWIRARVAPEPTSEPPGSGSETYINSVIRIYGNRSDFDLGNVQTGQPFPSQGNGVWRAHSTFHPVTGARRSADTLLDRNNPNLEIRTNSRVTKILFDGESSVPVRARVGTKKSRIGVLPRARCVRLDTGEVICVKEQGRIYLSAGALYTPALLIQSGIGPAGTRVVNEKVGQDLVDKPAMLVAGSFDHEFDNYNQLYFSHIAAIQKGSSGLRLYEELNAGIEAMLPLAVWQRNFVPTSLRNSFFAVTASNLVRFCRRNVVDQSFDGPALNLLCSAIEPIIAAGCDKRVFGYGVLSGEPSSRGSVTLDSDGRLVVDGNYMSTANDKNAMGRAARVGYEMLLSHTGPTAPQLPCIDKKDKACMSKSCPDLIADYVVTTRTVLKIMMPRQAKIFKSAPASVAYPQFLEPVITNTSATDDDIGELIKDEVFAAHHFAGTAAIGSVTGDDFAVLGVSGLYVVDGSALRTTPRANPMSTIMALGRLAGLKAVSDLSPTP